MPAGPIQSGHENTRKSWGKWLLCPGQTSKSPFIKFQDIWGGLHEVLKEYIKSSCIPKYSARRLIFPAPPKMLVQSNYSLLPSLKVGTMEVWDRSDGDSGIQTCRIWVDRNSWPVWYQLGDLVDKNRSQPKPCKESVYARRKHLCWFILQEIFQDFTETLATTHAKNWWFSSAMNHALVSAMVGDMRCFRWLATPKPTCMSTLQQYGLRYLALKWQAKNDTSVVADMTTVLHT